jgi:hypothetical protein
MFTYIIIFLATVGFAVQTTAAEKENLAEVYKELENVSKQVNLTGESWLLFLKKVDSLCDQKQEYCEFYYMLDSSTLMFEKDEYGDDGQCERTQANVEAYFRKSLPDQKKQVLSVVEKLCPKAQENLKKN